MPDAERFVVVGDANDGDSGIGDTISGIADAEFQPGLVQGTKRSDFSCLEIPLANDDENQAENGKRDKALTHRWGERVPVYYRISVVGVTIS